MMYLICGGKRCWIRAAVAGCTTLVWVTLEFIFPKDSGKTKILKTENSFQSNLCPSLIFGFHQLRPDQFRQIFHGNRALLKHGFMVSPQYKLISKLTFEFLPQSVVGHTPDEVRAQLG